jgi:hypothetical protein
VDDLQRARIRRRQQRGEPLTVADVDALVAEMPDHPPLVVGDRVQLDGDGPVLRVLAIDERRMCRCAGPDGEATWREERLVYAWRAT